MKTVEVCLNGTDWIPVNANCVDYIYEDAMPLLVILCDEMAELTMKSGSKTPDGKEEDAMRDEIVSLLTSIAQLGRSSGILLQVATQKPNATTINTQLRSNLGFRAFAGRATETGASIVALDNTLATTIDNTYPGAAIVQSAGVPVRTRVYFSKFEDVQEYYRQRGLDEKGYSPSELVSSNDNEDISNTKLDGGNEKIVKRNDSITFEFEKESIEIDKRQDQDWNEV